MSDNSGKKILVVDDEEAVSELLSYKLKRKGFNVCSINNPLEIMGKAKEFSPDLFILDVMMPNFDGINMCKLLRSDNQFSDVPIIFISARSTVQDRIVGLEAGADDYISKPFDGKEVILRINSILKRSFKTVDKESKQYNVANIFLDDSHYEVKVNGLKIDLTATEFKLLKLLMLGKGRVQTREYLLDAVWNYGSHTETRTIDTHMRRLREKLGNQASSIETIRGVGYRILDS